MVARPGWLGRAKRQLYADLRADPYLGYLLLGALVLAGFGFWHRIPIFATWDEHDRVLDALVAYAEVVHDPSLHGVREGVSWSRAPFGGTLWVYGLAVLPVIVAAALTGQLDAIAAMRDPAYAYGNYQVWADTPRWIWTWSIALVRLTNVLFAVVTVYLLYRLGTRLADRATGRLAALLLTLTFGFLKLAKEGGEDMPATMCFVAAVYLLVGYVQTGERRQFYAGCVAGGAAMAFKLTLALVVPVVVLAFLLRARIEDGPLRRVLWQPRLLVGGAALGAFMIVVGHPTALVGDFEAVAHRWFGRFGRPNRVVGPTAPTWWWFLRTYGSAFGWPLLAGAVGGLLASVAYLARRAPGRSALRERVPGFDERALVVGALVVFLLFFARWHDWRVHHILPTFPLAALLLADSLDRLCEHRQRVGRAAIALLVVTAAVYAGVGVGQFASMPRDEATEWLSENADEDDRMEVYFHAFFENAIPHGMDVITPPEDDRRDPCPEYIQVGDKELLYLQDIPQSQRSSEVDFYPAPRQEYIRALLDGEYNYEIVAEFGDRPPNFVPHRPEPGSLRELWPLGVYPHSDQYGDEVELASDQYVAILQLEGECVESRNAPW
ncbi:glycosyltransferase family 39 protein [Haloarcula onubensis]|uniref:Glycosyltransferase family 39 protein n=1 Tax=Haloarcula onubensis TaxID=2950539 RepID=A0ABU2FPE9_9EURY|nr:glycosyltransferase family 39 protein [Halomicroarcula sp. S3CR25-11]MDS0282289.1 glycosyltransferase family 39 protein [Halomicroarcula sp. S3CR25-11]